MATSMCSYGIIDPASRRYFIVNAKPGDEDDVDQTVVLKPSATQLATIQDSKSKDICSLLSEDGPAYTTLFMKYTTNQESVATARFVDESQLTVGGDHLQMLMAKFIGLLESRRVKGLSEEEINPGLPAVIVIGTNEEEEEEEEEEDGDDDEAGDGDGDDDDDDDDDDFVVAKHDDKLEKRIYSGLPAVIVIGRNEDEEEVDDDDDDDDEDGDDDDEEGDGDGDDDDDDDDDDFIVAKHDDYESSEEEKEGCEIEGEMCVICQEDYEEGAVIGTLECGHGYHPKCIKRWLAKKNVCPICRFHYKF